MDMTQTLEDMDDELQVLEFASTPTCTPKSIMSPESTKKSTTATGTKTSNAFDDCGGSKSKSDREDNLGGENVDGGDAKRAKSEVWNYFKRVGKINGVEKCQCKNCEKLYTCKPESGTNHLRRHFVSCFKTPIKYHDVGVMLDNQTTLAKKWSFDSKIYRDALARSIIQHDLSFSYVEYDAVNTLNKILNPDFKPISRNTAKSDCMNVYLLERDKLKSLLAGICGRICLTSDVWTAVTTQGYMTVTAHYVDDKWKLNTKLLVFCELDSAHSGLELSGKVLGVLRDWGIDSKIFSLTLDNATSNDSMSRILKERLNLQNDLLCQGEFFHVRCCAHILNIIVQGSLKAAEDALKKIRGSVKYVKALEGRLREFQNCIQEVQLGDVGGGFLRLDVSTRWNSTYMMLKSAIKYRRAFTSMSYSDKHYKLCPTDEEWVRGEKICAFLAPFYHITNLISGSSYPTSNLYFMQIETIEMKLNEFVTCQDEVIKEMASRMKVKFDKYWDEYSVTLAFGCVLHPDTKLRFLRFVYKKIYPQDFQRKVDRVKEALYKLFNEYARVSSFPLSSREGHLHSHVHPMTRGTSPSSSLDPDAPMYNGFVEELSQETSNEGKSELDIYLDEPHKIEENIEVLEFWKVNKHRFPRLAIMACDILSIPITTVASESTFSIGGRILNKYRNCLLPEIVQALICTRNWLHGFSEIGAFTDVQDVEEIRVSKEDSNVLYYE